MRRTHVGNPTSINSISPELCPPLTCERERDCNYNSCSNPARDNKDFVVLCSVRINMKLFLKKEENSFCGKIVGRPKVRSKNALGPFYTSNFGRVECN